MADPALLRLPPSRGERIAALNDRYRHRGAIQVLREALSDPDLGRVALVSSFGADSVVLLHMISVIDRATPVLFIDTQMLFPETLAYQSEVAARLGLTDLRVIRATPAEIAANDPDGDRHQSDPDGCCHLRKTVPLERALGGFDAWITGRKRFQGGLREEIDFFEAETDSPRIKINPLAHWSRDDVADYIRNNDLPRHPLVAQGFRSIGCAPCTSPVAPGEDDRAGRWRGRGKDECGIHFIGGRAVRADEIPGAHDNRPVIVTPAGFSHDDWRGAVLELGPDAELGPLLGRLPQTRLVRISFPAFSDGRGFTLARRLRMAGYGGRLRAAGNVIADQFDMALRSGFDEVEISADLARRQPWPQWQARAGRHGGGYLGRLGRR